MAPDAEYRGPVTDAQEPIQPARLIGLWARPNAGMVWGGVWLVYLVPAFVEALDARHSLALNAAGVGSLLLFVGLYLSAMRVAWDQADQLRFGLIPTEMDAQRWWLAGALVGSAVLSTVIVGEQGVATFVFLAPASSSLLPSRMAPFGIGFAVAATIVGELVARRYDAAPVEIADVLGSAFAATMAGLITFGVRRMRGVMWELEVARRDVERLATAQERVRIARDLHDVLGHSLTVISVKSQLAGRLIERGEVQRAGTEIREVETLSREAMADVREAVAGYRARTLAAELAAAEATLDSAGIAVTVERSTDAVPSTGEEALGFVVREGVTNVLRHSRARRCEIQVRHTGDAVVVELVDDGGGTGSPLDEIRPGDECEGGGNGLRGLAERVAAVGGRLSAGDAPNGGFVLRAEVAR